MKGKGKGSATITAKCGKLKAKCRVTVKKDEWVYHTDKEKTWYVNDFAQSPLSNLKIDIEGDRLFIEGQLKRSKDGKTERVAGNKHIFILSSKIKYWSGDHNISKEEFIYISKNYIKNWANTVGIDIIIENGEVVTLGFD